MRLTILLPAALAAFILALPAAPAAAQVPTSKDGVMSVLPTAAGADPNVLNLKFDAALGTARSRLRILSSPFVVIVADDSGQGMLAGPGCREAGSEMSPVRVICENKEGSGKRWGTFGIALGERSDQLVYKGTGPDMLIQAGGGDDTILAKDVPDPSYGLDTETYPHPNLRVNGGEGVDTIEINGPNYRAYGDGGEDTLTSVRLGGRVFGGAANDRLTLMGGGTATGGAGNDVLRATKAQQRTTLLGGAGDDKISGSPVDDYVIGGSGEDKILTGAGDDLVYVRDGGTRDIVNCGGGMDEVFADWVAADKTLLSCETANRSKEPPVPK